MKYNSLNHLVRSTNTKYLLKQKHEAFCKTGLHYQVIIKAKNFNHIYTSYYYICVLM